MEFSTIKVENLIFILKMWFVFPYVDAHNCPPSLSSRETEISRFMQIKNHPTLFQ
jgi:hypothetical protein